MLNLFEIDLKIEKYYEKLIRIPNRVYDDIMFAMFNELVNEGDVVDVEFTVTNSGNTDLVITKSKKIMN